NLIKQHKAQLSSDRTSCRSPMANQMRLILHTGAYWLLLDLRAAIPSWNPLRHTEFATIRLRLLKIASRIIEHASRIRIALASCCQEAETFSLVALKLQPSGPKQRRNASLQRDAEAADGRMDRVGLGGEALDPVRSRLAA